MCFAPLLAECYLVLKTDFSRIVAPKAHLPDPHKQLRRTHIHCRGRVRSMVECHDMY